jgi:hypothetical protein
LTTDQALICSAHYVAAQHTTPGNVLGEPKMTKIEELQKALKYADERDMVCECVDVLRDTLPVLIEAVGALRETLDAFTHCNEIYVPQLNLSALVREKAEAVLERLKCAD